MRRSTQANSGIDSLLKASDAVVRQLRLGSSDAAYKEMMRPIDTTRVPKLGISCTTYSTGPCRANPHTLIGPERTSVQGHMSHAAAPVGIKTLLPDTRRLTRALIR